VKALEDNGPDEASAGSPQEERELKNKSVREILRKESIKNVRPAGCAEEKDRRQRGARKDRIGNERRVERSNRQEPRGEESDRLD
jgi:hypothetical protein